MYDKEGRLIEKGYGGIEFDWRITDVGHIRADYNSNYYEIVFSNCNRLVLKGEHVFRKTDARSYQNEASPLHIIGTPFRLSALEIAEKDFSFRMDWFEAEKACSRLGNGWRLPTKDEQKEIWLNRNKFGDYKFSNYWSSSISEDDNMSVWVLFDGDGSQSLGYKGHSFGVRAVRK